MEATGDVEPGTTLKAIEEQNQANMLMLDVASNLAALVSGGPGAFAAKEVVKQSIKESAKKVVARLSSKFTKVEKITGPVGGKIIDLGVLGFSRAVKPAPTTTIVATKANPSVVLRKAGQTITNPGSNLPTIPKTNNAGKNLPGNIGSNQTKIHKNSHDFEGPSHTYKIYDLTLKRVHKKGKSSAGVRKRDGKSIRAEAQVRKLHRETGREFKSVIMHHFNNKKDAFYHQHELIKGMRKFWKEYDNILPGNKGNY